MLHDFAERGARDDQGTTDKMGKTEARYYPIQSLGRQSIQHSEARSNPNLVYVPIPKMIQSSPLSELSSNPIQSTTQSFLDNPIKKTSIDTCTGLYYRQCQSNPFQFNPQPVTINFNKVKKSVESNPSQSNPHYVRMHSNTK